jgi:hypothetical protein
MQLNRKHVVRATGIAVVTLASLTGYAGGPSAGNSGFSSGGPNALSSGGIFSSTKGDRGPSTANANRGGPGQSSFDRDIVIGAPRDGGGGSKMIFQGGGGDDAYTPVAGGVPGTSIQGDVTGSVTLPSATGSSQRGPGVGVNLAAQSTSRLDLAPDGNRRNKWDLNPDKLPDCK